MNQHIDPFDELAAMFLTAPQPQPPGAMSPAMPPQFPSPDRAPASALASASSVTPMSPAPRNAMTEMLIVGHLPVRGSLWLVPYADALARQIGTVALVRLDGQEPTLNLLRAPEAYTTAPLRMPLRQALMDVSPCVDVWMLRGPENMRTEEALDCRPDRITILSSADEAAVVAAYQSIKELAQAAEHPHRTLPALGMAMVGCERDAAEAVIDRLNRTTVSFLGVEVKLVALLPRMDAGIRCTRYVTFGQEEAPGMLEIRQWIEQAKAVPSRHSHQPQSQPQPDVIGRVHAPPEAFVMDAARILRTDGPARAPAAQPAFSGWTPPPISAPKPPVMPAAVAPPQPAVARPVEVSPAERDDLIGAIGPAGGAKLPPKVVVELEHKSHHAQRPVVEPDDHGAPVALAKFVAGLTPLPLRPPGHERVEIAVDGAGRMHLLAREASLRELPVVMQWAKAHREILAMACPTLRFDPAAAATCHVFTAEPATLADLHGANLRLHVLAPVSVGERTAWYAAPLNVVT